MNSSKSLIISGLAAIGASACCVLPLILLMLGVGGAGVTQLTQLEPLRPYFVAATLIFLVLAGYKLYWARRACAVDRVCADDRVLQRQRLIFWVVATTIVALLVFPYLAPFFY